MAFLHVFKNILASAARRLLLYCLLWLIIVGARASASPLRVALAVQAQSLTVSCPKGFVARQPDGKIIFTGNVAEFNVEQSSLFINGKPASAEALQLQPNAPFRLNKRDYRGLLEIRLDRPFLDAINWVPLEEYLYSVIGAELPRYWPKATVKAQAVIARTYALKKQEIHAQDSFDVVDTVEDQAYGGIESETMASRAAADETRGEILTYHGDIILAYYHADCGGITEKGGNVFPGDFPYLQSVACPFAKNSPYQTWTKYYSLSELSERLGKTVHDIRIEKDAISRRISRVTLDFANDQQTLAGFEFRKRLGYENMRSTNCSMERIEKTIRVPREKVIFGGKVAQPVVSESYRTTRQAAILSLPSGKSVSLISRHGELSENVYSAANPLAAVSQNGTLSPIFQKLAAELFIAKEVPVKISVHTLTPGTPIKHLVWETVRIPVAVTFIGHGWGHGVGLCQWGARGMALLGKTYREILHYYYRDVEIEKR